MTKTPKYRRRVDRNYAFVEYQGERIPLPGDYGSRESRRAYVEFLANIEADDPLEIPQFGELRVGELMAKHLVYAKRHYHDSDQTKTSREYKHHRAVSEIIKDLDEISNMPISDFGPKCLREVRDCFVAAEWSRQYCNAQTKRVRRAFKWGVGQELVKPETAAALTFVEPLRMGRTKALESKGVKCADLAAVLEVASHAGPVVGSMLRLHALTGMRPQNICLITPEQIDSKESIWIYRPIIHKNAWRVEEDSKHKLAIPIGPQSQAILGPFLGRKPNKPCFSPRESEKARRGKFAKRTSRAPRDAYDTATYGRAVRWAIKRANKARFQCLKPIKHFTPGQVRHTFATLVREANGLEAAQALLGHAKADTTQIYAEKNLKLAMSIAQEIG